MATTTSMAIVSIFNPSIQIPVSARCLPLRNSILWNEAL
jgi:hypothetical protein